MLIGTRPNHPAPQTHTAHLAGLGMFDSMDFRTWSTPEWVVVGVGAYTLLSFMLTTRRGVRAVGNRVRSSRAKKDARKRRIEEVRKEAKELGIL